MDPVKCAVTLCAGLIEVDRAPFVGEVLIDHLRNQFDPLTRLLQPLQDGAGKDGHAVESETRAAIRFNGSISWSLS